MRTSKTFSTAFLSTPFPKYGYVRVWIVVNDGRVVLDYLSSQEVTEIGGGVIPDVILLDVNFPKVSCLKVLRRIRGHPRTKVIPVLV